MTAAAFTEELGRYIAEGSRERLPALAVESAKQLFLDTIGVMLAGAREPAARIVRRIALTEGGEGQALIVGTNKRTSPTAAALANGTSAHALDLDDSHHPGFLHPSAVLVPTVLALGELRHSSGSDVLAAYLYGLDTIAAIGSAINLRHYELGWHATATIGTLGSTAAGARLLGLDPRGTSTALSLAASQAAGVRRNFGSMAKPLHAGLAARSGVFSALLAAEGLTAGEAVLEGERGFFDLVAGPGTWDAERGLSSLDHRFELAVDGLGLKQFASCGVTHSPIEAALLLRARDGAGAAEIAELELVVNPLAREIAMHDDPSDGLQSKFSLPHCVAVAFLAGAAGLDQFTDERVHDPAVAALRRRVRITTDPEIGLAGHMSFGCGLTAVRTDGRTSTVAVEMARGKWVGERLSQDEIEVKYRSCAAAGGASDAASEDCRAVVMRLDELADIAELTAALGRAGSVE